MAEEKEVIVFEIDVSSYEKALKTQADSIALLTQQQKELRKAAADGNEAAAVSLEKVNAQLKVQQQEYRTTQSVLVGYYAQTKKGADTTNFLNNSISQNRALLKQLTASYIDAAKPSAELTNSVKRLSETLKQQEAAIGDTRRNVGNYGGAFTEAFSRITSGAGGAIGAIGKVGEVAKIGFKLAKDSVDGAVSSFNNLKAANEEYKVAQEAYVQAQTVASAATETLTTAQDTATKIGFKYAAGTATLTEVEAANAAVTGAVAVETEALASAQVAGAAATTLGANAMKLFRVALISTGIGAFVVAVGLLIDYFRKFDPLVDALEQGMAAFGAAVRTTQQALVSFLSGDFGAFSNFKEDLKGAANAAIELKKAQQDLADQNSIQEVQNAKVSQQYSELILKSKNRTLSEQERLAFLKQAEKLEADNFKKRTELSKQQTEQAIEATRIAGDLNATEIKYLREKGTAYAFNLLNAGKITQKEVDLIKKAEVDIIAIQQESTNRLEKNQNAQDKLFEDAQKAEEKRLADLKKKRDEELKAEQERAKALDALAAKNKERERIYTEATTEGIQQRLALFELDFEDKREKLRDAGVQEVDILKQYEAEKTAIIDAENEKRNASLEKVAERNAILERLRIEALKIGLEQENALYELNFENRIEDLRAAGLTEIEIEELKQQELDAIRTKYAEKAKADSEQLTKDQVSATTGIVSEGLNVLGQIGSILDSEIDAKQQKLQEALENGSINQQQYADETTKLKKKQFEQNKAIATTSAILQGINATLAAYTSGAAIPIVGAVTGPVFAALAAAFAAVQVGLIASQQPPKFATGVIGLEGAGTATSDSIDAKLSRGESVVTAKATSRFHKELAQMELAVGNTPNYNFSSGRFATGAISIPGTDAGFSTNSIQTQVNEQAILNSINTGLQNMPAPVVSVREFVRVQDAGERSVRVAEL
jgi:hypothetical protein